MKLLAIEAVQHGKYFHPRYEQIIAYGHEVYLLAGQAEPDHWHKDRFCIASSKRVSDMVQAARLWHQQEMFDGVFSIAETSVVAAAAVAEALNLTGISPQAARQSRNKLFMRQSHQRGNAPHPPFRYVESLASALQAAASIGYPVVLKPTLGAASSFVFRIDSDTEMQARFEQARLGIGDMVFVKLEAEDPALGPNGLLVEGFLDGREMLIEAYTWDGVAVLGSVVDRVTVEGTTFDDDVHHAPADLDADTLEAVRRAVELGARAQGLQRSVLHAEVRFHQGHPHLLEIAARPGGGGLDHMARLSAGYCPIQAVIDVALGRKPQHKEFQTTGLHTAAMVLLCASGRIQNVVVPERLYADPSLFFLKITAKVGDTMQRPPLGNSIVGFIGATGASFDEAMAVATKAANQIKIEMENNRVGA